MFPHCNYIQLKTGARIQFWFAFGEQFLGKALWKFCKSICVWHKYLDQIWLWCFAFVVVHSVVIRMNFHFFCILDLFWCRRRITARQLRRNVSLVCCCIIFVLISQSWLDHILSLNSWGHEVVFHCRPGIFDFSYT